jgi:hypothetical protein
VDGFFGVHQSQWTLDEASGKTVGGGIRWQRTESRSGGTEIVFRGAVSLTARRATDLRHGADWPRLPLSRLPLSPDQPASYRDMRHIRRGSSWALFGTACRLWPIPVEGTVPSIMDTGKPVTGISTVDRDSIRSDKLRRPQRHLLPLQQLRRRPPLHGVRLHHDRHRRDRHHRGKRQRDQLQRLFDMRRRRSR